MIDNNDNDIPQILWQNWMQKYERILLALDPKQFIIPIEQESDSYFPRFLKKKLDAWLKYYETSLVPVIDEAIEFGGDNIDADTLVEKRVVFRRLEKLCNTLNKTIEFYYNGDVEGATNCFFQSLDEHLVSELQTVEQLNVKKAFYRIRLSQDNQLRKNGIFHLPFELRHLQPTNRYSIPGLPSLYLGDSSYSCWEEYERPDLKNSWFAKFENTEVQNVFVIERYEDFLVRLENESIDLFKQTHLLRYLSLYPINIACSIKVNKPKSVFKPEYIIPQLLLQYVARSKALDISKEDNKSIVLHGIKYPSTKVNYSKLKGVSTYNYVFPIRISQENGFCPVLSKSFILTEPTTINLEEILNYSISGIVDTADYNINNEKYVEIIENERSLYQFTAFGFIEDKLENKSLSPL